MTISPADAARAALVAALIAWPLCAGAQTPATDAGTPPDTATSAPQTLPGVTVQQGLDSAPPAATRPAGGGVEVAPLGSVEGAPAGLLDGSNGGLGSDIWSGSPRGEIDRLLEALPIASPVYSERELARRLLLTIADAPVGAAPHAFLTVRLQALLKAGFVLEAAIIAANAQVANDPEYARVAADAILFAGHAGDACGNATALRLQNSDRFWMELRAYCYAVAGDGAALDLTRSVMAAQGGDEKAFDILLTDVLTHKANDPGPIPNPTSLDLFLLRQVGLPVNVGFAKQLGMPALVLALDDARNAPEDRAAAAEDILCAGAVPMAHLSAVADAQKFTPDQFAEPKIAAAPLPFFLAQALLRQSAAHADANGAKASLVTAALAQGEKADLFEVAAGLQADAAATVAPEASMPTEAGLTARALMLAGRPDAAARWKDGFDSKAGELRADAFAVELNLVAPDPARAANAQSALAWFAQQAAINDPQGISDAQEFAALAIGICDALDEQVAPEIKTAAASFAATHWPGRRPPEAAMEHLNAAAREPGRKGEALLRLLNAVGRDGPGDLAPDVTVHFVRTLEKLGIPDAARLLAIDALLLYKPAPPPPPPVAPAAAAPPPAQ